ncbi:transporter substrate-binding domain-containing protein [Fulvivirgaceae bacterium BMA12]|uniref:histidine kinase n=1 Tax=Agaribacillus aureus TaxID=3051825 RepID=A0ABT8KZQ1_9BACT|nr:transporter substrate-binding domain-containing protein [Fulvivirgaceae bacterium BMA12]
MRKIICVLAILAGTQYMGFAQKKADKTIIYGGDKHYPPFEFVNAKGQPDGFHVDLFRAIGEVMGFQVTFKFDDWSRIRQMLEAEEAIDVTDMFFSAERTQVVEFANSHAVVSHELITRDGTKNIEKISDIANATVVVEKGSILEDLLKKSELQLTVIGVNDELEALNLLAQKKYDYALVSGYQAHRFIAENKASKLSPVGPVVLPLELAFATSKGRTNLIQEINTGLEILKKTGKYSKIYVKWFGEKEESILTKISKWVGLSLFILLVLSVFWIQTLRRMVKTKTVAIKSELNEKINAEKRLKSRELELKEAQKLANLGSWKYDFESETIEWSEEQKTIFGLAINDPVPDFEKFIEFIHPQDREMVTDLFSNACDNPIIYTFEVRAVNKKKENKNLWIKIKPTYDGLKDKIVGLNGTVMDITFIKDVQTKLEIKNEELQKKNLELDKFTYSISHDIKAPIASILGLINLMSIELTDKKSQEYIEKIKLSIDKLNNYVRDVLAFSANENKKINADVIDFEAIIAESFALYKYLKGAKDIDLIVNINLKEEFLSHKSRLLLIFSNIISNAIKYQRHDKSDSYIKITVSGNSEKVDIIIEDNGEGINDEHMEHVFDMFYRGSLNSEGSGLGLYIVREVVHKLNGTIHVQNLAGGGTVFAIGIPSLALEKS